MTCGEVDVRNLDNIIELNHPLIKYKLGLLRKKQRGTNKFECQFKHEYKWIYSYK